MGLIFDYALFSITKRIQWSTTNKATLEAQTRVLLGGPGKNEGYQKVTYLWFAYPDHRLHLSNYVEFLKTENLEFEFHI